MNSNLSWIYPSHVMMVLYFDPHWSLSSDSYAVKTCDPRIQQLPEMLLELNETHNIFQFVHRIRHSFVEYSKSTIWLLASDPTLSYTSCALREVAKKDQDSGKMHLLIQLQDCIGTGSARMYENPDPFLVCSTEYTIQPVDEHNKQNSFSVLSFPVIII